MKTNQKPIKTERLMLRGLNKEDWEMISYLRSDQEINKFVKRPSAETKEEALKFISEKNKDVDNGILYYWAISEIKKSKMIGSICLWNISKDRKTAEIGYDLVPSYQGKGFMLEALKTIVEFGFVDLNLKKIEAYTQYNNNPSIKLLKKCGFKLIEGKKDCDNENNLVFRLLKELVN